MNPNSYFFAQRGLPFLLALHSRASPLASWEVVPTEAFGQNLPARGSFDLLFAKAGEASRANARAAAMVRMGIPPIERWSSALYPFVQKPLRLWSELPARRSMPKTSSEGRSMGFSADVRRDIRRA